MTLRMVSFQFDSSLAMMATPKKLVHWDTNSPSFSNPGSPFYNGTFDSSMDSTSSLDFVNSQLVAHGYIPSPGLSLTGISKDESNRVVKCLISMLSQRVDDMSRTEELATKLRTLSYDHERMSSMYRAANDKSANAEREMNLHKSRLATSVKSLQASENAHKQTSTELQRTRTLLQGVRATHHAELKKKEKEIERIMDKWQKLADVQSKVSAAPSGIRCSNTAVLDGAEVLDRGRSFLDIALEQAEQARAQLGDENLLLRKLLVCAVNEIQSILHQAKCKLSNEHEPEPSPMTLSTLFPFAPSDAANDKLSSVLKELRDALSELSRPMPTDTKPVPQIPDDEVERLQTIITNLKEELERSQKQSLTHVAETQAMFDKFAEDHRISTGEIDNMSVELMSVPLQDEAKERLDKLRKELDMERQKFTDAAIVFGKEKAALEAERLKFLDEKRAWQVELMLAEFPPTPAPASPVRLSTSAFKLTTPKKSPHKSPHKSLHKLSPKPPQSPRRSPAKNICVGKAGSSRKAHRVSRHSLASPVKGVLSFETEYIPPLLAPSFSSTKSLAPSTSTLLPTSFVLPPPSPRATLPTEPALPPPVPESPPSPDSTTSAYTPETSPPPSGSNLLVPSTPPAAKRSFPVAKPFAMHMVHAYSPAKPSPLSRILMLADSPLTPSNGPTVDIDVSPTSGPLESVPEELDEDDGGLGFITNVPIVYQPSQARMSATELGIDSPPETPLQERKVEPNVGVPSIAQPVFGRAPVFHPDPNAKKGPIAAEKGKARAVDHGPRARTSAVSEKENKDKPPLGKSSKTVNAIAPAARKMSTAPRATVKPTPAVSTTVTTSRTSRPPIKPPVPMAAGVGPRRVLINSADAPVIAKGRK
ncbi:hypothetical protein BDN70DRAFT_884425 [Pholiota conissans]|uniref:Afadin and alpha-actinin-binding-domain-containing protein n=1 Tax=Pholiota conissans TaxID=109636 RepID=A0A9P5YUF8_9AGAR|nr:hypothetical protein BDN70DRAFT_884425 [Pholiota conissans]